MRSRSWLLWTVAFLITIASAVYQRVTGPTYPVTGRITIGPEVLTFKLPRSHENPGDAEIAVPAAEPGLTGTCEYRRHPSSDTWTVRPLVRRNGQLIAWLPNQPAAGKIMYRVFVSRPGVEPVALTREPLVLRFKDYVPRVWVLYPHILVMFAAILCSTRAGLEALARSEGIRVFSLVTAVLIAAGGLVFGPAVQKYAFGAWWTGWPAGNDLTDNKTAAALVFWVIALLRTRNGRDARGWVILAAAVTLLIFAIPHSVLGSQLDHTKGP